MFKKKKGQSKEKPDTNPEKLPRILKSNNPIRVWQNRLPEPSARAKREISGEGSFKLVYINEKKGTAILDMGGTLVEVPLGEEVEVDLGSSGKVKVRLTQTFESDDDIAGMILRTAEGEAGELMKDYDVDEDWKNFNRVLKKRKKDGDN